MERGSNGVLRKEMDSPKSDKDEDIDIGFWNGQIDLWADELRVLEFGEEVEVSTPCFKGIQAHFVGLRNGNSTFFLFCKCSGPLGT
jgi:hypothetical protein